MQTPAQNLQILELKKPEFTNTKQLVTTEHLQARKKIFVETYP